jgi:hypothetical protein
MLASPEELLRMGARLRALTEAHYLWSEVVGRYRELFERVCSVRGAA